MAPVDHEAGEREQLVAQLGALSEGLRHREGLWPGDDQEAAALAREQGFDRGHPLLQPGAQVEQGQGQRGQVTQHLPASEGRQRTQDETGRQPLQTGHAPRPPGRHGLQKPAQAGLSQQGHEAPRRVEEVERVLLGGRVQDDQVVALLLHQIVELLERGQVVAAGEGLRHVLKQPVPEDAIPCLRAGRVAGDELLQAMGCVEHHGPELTVALTGDGGHTLELHPLRLRPDRLQPQRGGKPACRIDREHEGAPAMQRALQRQRGSERGLAHSAATQRDQDLLAADLLGQPPAHWPSPSPAQRSR